MTARQYSSIIGCAVALLCACAHSGEGKTTTLDVVEAKAIAASIRTLELGKERVPDCKVRVESNASSIEVSFIERRDSTNEQHVGAISSDCGFTFVIDNSSFQVIRKYYHR